ncbi:MAG TPA: membrane protein insertase YidC, partial [Phycisphaerae bacterium]|nr:membrane protein insertase YidC [Phycisphaerae bacterium]
AVPGGSAAVGLSGAGPAVRFQVEPAEPQTPTSEQPVRLGEAVRGGPFAMAVELTPRGSGIRHLELSDYYASVEDRHLSDAERRHFPLVQRDLGRPGFAVTRLDLTYRDNRPAETVSLSLPPETPLSQLHGGAGVRLGSIELRNGSAGAKIYLSACRTVQDVITTINANGIVPVAASVSPAGDGLILIGGEGDALSVNEADGGSTAADLGILQPEALAKGQALLGRSLGWEAPWQLDGAPTAESVRLRLTIRREGEPLVTLYRTFRLTRRTTDGGDLFGDGSAFLLAMDIEAVDHSGLLSSCAVTMRGPEGLMKEESRGDDRMAVGGFVDAKRAAEFKTGGDAREALKSDGEKHKFTPPLDWVGMVDKYFTFVAARADLADLSSRFDHATAYPAYTDEKKETVPGVVMRTFPLRFQEKDGRSVLAAGFYLFAGPKDANLLDRPLLRERNFGEVISYSRGCCIDIPGVAFISKAMVWAINELADVVVNKGVAVILLVVVVRLLMLPISRYSQLSMLRMQDLQPEVAKLKEQFGDDPKRVQMESLKLYRERGANPMLGCVPMALQMPVWIALYTGIQVAISLRHAPFVLWIQDLAQPDALLQFAPVDVWGVSFIGNWAQWQLNVLPVLMIVAMFLQMRMQPQSAATTPEMAKQQQMMKFMMPAMLLFFLYTAPSALNLYILVSSLLGFFEGKYIRSHHAKLKLRPQKPRKEKKPGRIGQWIDAQMGQVERLQNAAKKSENPLEKRKPRK